MAKDTAGEAQEKDPDAGKSPRKRPEIASAIANTVKKSAAKSPTGATRKRAAKGATSTPSEASATKRAGATAKKATVKKAARKAAAPVKSAIAKTVKKAAKGAAKDASAKKPAKKTAKKTAAKATSKTASPAKRAAGKRTTKTSSKEGANPLTMHPTKPKNRISAGEDSPLTSGAATPFGPAASWQPEAPAPAAPPFFDPHTDPRPLPEKYGATRLTLLVRDPEWLFAYWEVSDEDRARLRESNGGEVPGLTLRVHDVTGVEFDGGNSHSCYDLPLTDIANSWYIHVAAPDRSWIADLGWRDATGRFQVLARSNSVATPRRDISTVHDEQWMQVDEERFEEVYRLSGGGADLLHAAGSETIALQIAQRMLPQYLLGASEQFAGASEIMMAERAKAPEGAPAEAPFRLEVEFELIVRGRTEPDALVQVCGEPVRLRPDGSFSLRMELPAGERLIPVKAVKADESQERRVVTRVAREAKE